MSWTIGVLGIDSRRGLGICLFTTKSRTALGPTQPPIQWAPGALSVGVKRPGREADHSSPSSAEVKEWMELYLHSPTPSLRFVQFKKKLRDNFTFTFTLSLSLSYLPGYSPFLRKSYYSDLIRRYVTSTNRFHNGSIPRMLAVQRSWQERINIRNNLLLYTRFSPKFKSKIIGSVLMMVSSLLSSFVWLYVDYIKMLSQ
jgi:hypothetical protein